MRQVVWHDGGQMFSTSETEYPPGWYLLSQVVSPEPVEVYRPFTTDPLLPAEGTGLLED